MTPRRILNLGCGFGAITARTAHGRALLFIIDGAKALRKVITDSFGTRALIHAAANTRNATLPKPCPTGRTNQRRHEPGLRHG